MRAAILSIGDELTLGQNLDTNSAWLSARLAEVGVLTVEHRTVADDRPRMAHTIGELIAEHDVLIITGGLGPTADDLTREALGDVLTPGCHLLIDEAALEHLQNWFVKRGRAMPELNKKQAQRPASMRIMQNPHGTAPGLAGQAKTQACDEDAIAVRAPSLASRLKPQVPSLIFALPGPPREMQPMFQNHVLPVIRERRAASGEMASVLRMAMVQEFGMGESVAAEKLRAMMDRDRHPLVGTTAGDSIVVARIRASGEREWANRETERIAAEIERLWHPYAFGRDGVTLVDAVAVLLKDRQHTLATAESCTGGWLGKSIVDRAGSSDFYRGGWVTYSNQMKIDCLGVSPEVIAQHGAVSREVAEAMANGALRESGADWALSITGIAGPDGGSKEKPVGTVWIALTKRTHAQSHKRTKDNDGLPFDVHARRFEFPGERATVRDRSVNAALQMLRFALMGLNEHTPLLWEAPGDRADGLQPVCGNR